MKTLGGLALLALLAAGGCTTMRHETGPGDMAAWQARQGALAPFDRWRLDGRVSIEAGRDAYSGSLTWIQDGATLDFQFKGPFGFGGLRIWGGAEALNVRTHKGETFTVTDPEREFGERIGWSLPIRSMRFWIAGVAAPGIAAEVEVDRAGLPLALKQQGWTVTYEGFQRVGALELPQRLAIAREGVRIKVAAERWDLKGASGEVGGFDAADDLDL